jgi:catechol 1,2-dioxygenase
LFVAGDPYLASDAVFGVRPSLVVPFVRSESAAEASRLGVPAPFYTVDYDFVLAPA